MGGEILLVQEIHHLLILKKSSEAQALLTRLPEKEPAMRKEHSYLQAWLAAEQGQWEMVAQQVRDMPVWQEREQRERLLTMGTTRRRRPMCLLMLGEMAHQLGYREEAVDHAQHALTFLNERRMNIPEVRVLAHVSLGRLALEMNQTAQALLQFQTARLLYPDGESQSPLHAALLAGLCEAQMLQELFEQALATGKQALALLPHNGQAGQREYVLLLLSRTSVVLNDYVSALAYAQEASETANQRSDPVQLAHTLLTLATIQQKGCALQEARHHCEQALALLGPTSQQTLRGNALFLLGTIVEDEWRQDPARETSACEAQMRYEQAQALFEEQCDSASLARLSTRLANLLETRGELALALVHWKQAFQLSSGNAFQQTHS